MYCSNIRHQKKEDQSTYQWWVRFKPSLKHMVEKTTANEKRHTPLLIRYENNNKTIDNLSSLSFNI